MSAYELGRYFIPGPTEVHSDVAAAMLRPMMSHRGAEFRALFARIQARIRPVFATSRPVLIAPASATAMMEMAVRAAPPGRVLALVNGGFSERFADVAEACGREVDRYTVEWGAVFDLGELAARLARAPCSAVTVVQCETTTGVLTDVRAVAAEAHAHGAAVLVDAVSSLAGAACETDAWGLDFVFTGSQKVLALPPGLALGVATESLVAHARANAGRGRYLDVAEYADAAVRNETPSTPALSLLFALDAQLDRMTDEGVDARLARHRAMAAAVHEWAATTGAAHGVAVLAPDGARSPTVSVLRLPSGLRANDLLAAMGERGVRLASGYGPLKGTCVRIGHMGEHDAQTVGACLGVLSDVLARRRR